MATATNINLIEHLERAIQDAIKNRIAEVSEEALKKAIAEIESSVRSEIDKIALSLAKDYSVMDNITHLSIHVRKNM